MLAELDCSDYRNAYDSAVGQANAAARLGFAGEERCTRAGTGAGAGRLRARSDEYQRQKYLYDHQSLPANDFHKIEAAYLDSQQRYNMAHEGTRG